MTRTIPAAAHVDVKAKTPGTSSVTRIASIDIIRALTMVLMIFVNDLGSLTNIPLWMQHVKPGVDGIGLADVVFPAFLFIVGLSLPFAISNRRNKGDSDLQLCKHILSRTVALLVMGVFLVNGETIHASATGLPRYMWNPLCCMAFIITWNNYPARFNRRKVLAFRAAGILILALLAFMYRGGKAGEVYRFSQHWWGILGLIGWAYLASALITVFSRGRFLPLMFGWLFFCLLSIIYKAKLLHTGALQPYIPEAILGGTLTALTMGGVLTSWVFSHYQQKGNNMRMTVVFVLSALVLIAMSVYTRGFWGLAKLGATPAWLFLCSAITLLAFTIIYWTADVLGKAQWFNLIKPAGTDTLLCYLVPILVLFVLRTFRIHFPGFMLAGGLGLVKSFLFAMFCVWFTGVLNRAGIRLKL